MRPFCTVIPWRKVQFSWRNVTDSKIQTSHFAGSKSPRKIIVDAWWIWELAGSAWGAWSACKVLQPPGTALEISTLKTLFFSISGPFSQKTVVETSSSHAMGMVTFSGETFLLLNKGRTFSGHRKPTNHICICRNFWKPSFWPKVPSWKAPTGTRHIENGVTAWKTHFFGRNFCIWFTFEPTEIAFQLGAGPNFPIFFSRH